MVLDLILIAILVGSIASGFAAGLARTGIGIAAAIAAILLGFWFYRYPAALYLQWMDAPSTANVLGFLTVLFVVMAIGAIVGRIVSTVFKWTGLSWIDRIAGAAFGLVQGSLVAAAFVAVLLAFAPKPTPNWMTGSAVLPYALGVADVSAGLAPQSIKSAFATTVADIRNVWNKQVERARERVRDRDRKKGEE